ncbi:MAG TPA: tetratricopeptide repeat protein [Terriglobales bacterium]|nr:tetratricopeptide repeat protein [Terriglobales bacterium]
MDDTLTQGPRSQWQAKQVYIMATICLLIGLAVGYLLRGSQSPNPASASAPAPAPTTHAAAPAQQMPTMEQMKQMGDKAAESLLAKLKTDPNNADLLVQIGNVYKSTHQFKDAAGYYESSLKINPKNVPIRTELASCLFYAGDADGALAQLQQSLKDDPKDANSLFNLGVIRWKAKKDTSGAIAAWQQLLNSNPKLEDNKRAQVEKLIADVRSGVAN